MRFIGKDFLDTTGFLMILKWILNRLFLCYQYYSIIIIIQYSINIQLVFNLYLENPLIGSKFVNALSDDNHN